MRYQYRSPGFNAGIDLNTPAAVKLIVLINIIVFFLTEIFRLKYIFFELFGLVPKLSWSSLQIWQPITYIFLHSGFFHIFINMLVLWMFGKELEYRWGKNKFLLYYFITGVGSGIITVLFNPFSMIPVVGASGAVYGILMAYTLIYPNRRVYIYGIFPIQIKYMMLFLGFTAFFASITQFNSTISHMTHLSGMIIGFIYLKWNKLIRLMPKIKIHDENNINVSKNEKFQDDIDIILEKLKLNGWEGLNESEKNYLFNASKYYSKDQSPN